MAELLHRRRSERERRVAQLLHPLAVVLLDRLDTSGHVVERMTVRGEPELHAVERGDEIEGLDVRAAARRPLPTPEMCGVIDGSTWSPESSSAVLRVVQAEVVDRVARACARSPTRGPRAARRWPCRTRRVGSGGAKSSRMARISTRRLQRRHRVLRPAPRRLAAPGHRLALHLGGRVVAQRVALVVVGVIGDRRDLVPRPRCRAPAPPSRRSARPRPPPARSACGCAAASRRATRS